MPGKARKHWGREKNGGTFMTTGLPTLTAQRRYAKGYSSL